jgi:hypothetical protein
MRSWEDTRGGEAFFVAVDEMDPEVMDNHEDEELQMIFFFLRNHVSCLFRI